MATNVKFGLVTREQVMGALKMSGSKDPDVILAAKEEFASNYRPLKWFGIWAMVCGGLMTALIVMAPLGIPLFILGIWWFKRAGKNAQTISAAYTEYLGTSSSTGPGPFRAATA